MILGLWSLRRLVVWGVATFAAILTLIGASGCSSSNAKPSRPHVLLVAVDRSASMSQMELDTAGGYFITIAGDLLKEKKKPRIVIWTFAHEAALRYEGTPEYEDELYSTNTTYIRGGAPMEVRYTKFAPVLDLLYERAQAAGSNAIVSAMLLTDGASNDNDKATEVAKKLAALPQFRVMMVAPVSNEHNKWYSRDKLRQVFPGEKFLISSDTEGGQALDRFEALAKEN